MTSPTPPPLDLAHVDHRQVARMIAVLRCVLGTALVVTPGLLGRRWIGDAADGKATRLFIRAMGARDLALAVGTLRALDGGAGARDWVTASAASDATDVVATVLATPTIGLRRALPVVASAGAAALAGFAASTRVDGPHRSTT